MAKLFKFYSFVVFLLIIRSSFSQGNIVSVFDHIGASKEQISHERCQQVVNLSQDKLDQYLSNLSQNDQTKTISVGGLLLKNESVRLSTSYKRLTSYLNYKLRPVADIDFWNLFKDGRCLDAICAAKEVFGTYKGSFYLAFLVKTGLSLSPLGYDRLRPPIFDEETEASEETIRQFNGLYKVMPWQHEELTAYLDGVFSMPDFLFPLPYSRLAKSSHDHWRSSSVHSNATIMMYPGMLQQPPEYQKYTMVHEIGHIIGTRYGVDVDREWIDISWVIDKETNRVVRKNDLGFISSYSKQDFFEDFAESFAAFRFNPEGLKSLAPEKFDYLKNKIFKGQDYLEGSDCSKLSFSGF